jgi:hypothetical protein
MKNYRECTSEKRKRRRKKQIKGSFFLQVWSYHTSYLKIPPEEPGWRIITLETTPVAERMQTARAPFWENTSNLVTISCRPQNRIRTSWHRRNNEKHCNYTKRLSKLTQFSHILQYLSSMHGHYMRGEASSCCFCCKTTFTWRISK